MNEDYPDGFEEPDYSDYDLEQERLQAEFEQWEAEQENLEQEQANALANDDVPF